MLIPCAGSGSRAGSAGPKQYQPLAGQPLVAHTLAAFAATPGLAGVLVPVTLDRFDVDPAVASSVFVTTCTDSLGFFTFLGLAALWGLGG